MRTNACRSRMVRFYWNRTLLAGPLLFEIEARFPILEYHNPVKELKIVHRAFWKFALWPGINESPHTSSGGTEFIMPGPGLRQEDL